MPEYAKYTRPPSIREIIAAFPAECRALAPKRLAEQEEMLEHATDILEETLKDIPARNRDLVREFVLAFHYDWLANSTEVIRHLKAIRARIHADPRRELDVDKAREYPLVDLCHEYGIELRHNGSRYVGLCPFHEDSHPSFYVFDDNCFHCYGCGAHGDTIEFVMKLDGCVFQDAVRKLT